MPDDDDDNDVLGKDVMTPVEILESATLGCLEMLRRKRVCLFPGPHVPVQAGEIADFAQCLRYLGDCNALIFCAPHLDKKLAQGKVQHYVGGGDPALVFDLNECVGMDHDWIGNADLLFPQKTENRLIARPAPGAEAQPTRPSDDRFWAHYVILSIIGRNDKLHLLHLGLCGDHAWPYFLQPNRIEVVRVIADLP